MAITTVVRNYEMPGVGHKFVPWPGCLYQSTSVHLQERNVPSSLCLPLNQRTVGMAKLSTVRVIPDRRLEPNEWSEPKIRAAAARAGKDAAPEALELIPGWAKKTLINNVGRDPKTVRSAVNWLELAEAEISRRKTVASQAYKQYACTLQNGAFVDALKTPMEIQALAVMQARSKKEALSAMWIQVANIRKAQEHLNRAVSSTQNAQAKGPPTWRARRGGSRPTTGERGKKRP
jgi:hypothetical protein